MECKSGLVALEKVFSVGDASFNVVLLRFVFVAEGCVSEYPSLPEVEKCLPVSTVDKCSSILLPEQLDPEYPSKQLQLNPP